MSFQYDLFISYSSADRPWALKLFNDLQARNIRVFFDQNRLDVGKPWEPQLATAVQGSQHMIVIWTDNANESQWVRREVGYFETLNDPNISLQGNKEDRWYTFLLLEGENRAYAGIESISALKANVYVKNSNQKGADTVNDSLWQDVVAKLAAATKKDDQSTPIPLAVLAMTKDDLQKLDPNRKPIWGPDLNTLLKNLGIGDRETLLKTNSYGELRTDWHPFGHPLNIQQILDNLLIEINREEANKPEEKKLKEGKFEFRWEPIDQRFWTDNDVALAEQSKRLWIFSTIVIDPLSLYDDRVYDGFVTLSECFNNDRANIMVLTPFSLPQAFIDLSALVERRGRPFFNPYWNPPVPNLLKYANLGVNLGNEREVRRVVRTSVGEYVRQALPPNKAFSQ